MSPPMPVPFAFFLLAASPALAASPEPGQREDQMRAWQARREGRSVSLRDIERRIVPKLPDAQYLGAQYDGADALYTLKFVRDGQVIWVEVDAASGQVVGRSGR